MQNVWFENPEFIKVYVRQEHKVSLETLPQCMIRNKFIKTDPGTTVPNLYCKGQVADLLDICF